jgi:hypothetical protein
MVRETNDQIVFDDDLEGCCSKISVDDIDKKIGGPRYRAITDDELKKYDKNAQQSFQKRRFCVARLLEVIREKP